MNDNDVTSLPETSEQKSASKCRKKSCALWFFFFLILLVGAAVICVPRYIRLQANLPTQDIAQMQQRLTGLENSVRALDERVNGLNNTTTPAGGEIKEPSAVAKKSAGEIAHMQSDLVALSSALTALQNEVKESSSHAQRSQQATESTLASVIAYIQLRATAQTDQPYAAELSAMRDTSPNDPTFQEALGKLQPFATTGAQTITELHDTLLALEASAAQAIDQQKAQNWWQKFVTELKGLISVRRLHGGNVDAFGKMESDLAKNDLAAVLEDMKSLPIEAQNVLSDWHAQVEARQTITNALRDLADHFSALAKTHPGEP